MRGVLYGVVAVIAVSGGCRCGARDAAPSAPPAAVIDTATIDAATVDAGPGPDARRYLEDRAGFGGNYAYPDRSEIQSFGYKMAWIAVPTSDRAGLVAQLGLAAAREMPFVDAMDAAYDGVGTMVTPVVDGWTLVVGAGVLTADVTRLERQLVELSVEHGEAQAFLTHRYFEYHGYVLAREGRLVRSYVYDGEAKGVVRDVGARLPEETGLPARFDGPGFLTPGGMITDGRLPPEARSEGDVMSIADAWSVSPLQFGAPAHPAVGPTLLAGPLRLE